MNFLHQKINKNFSQGFTLIELLVVIAVIGLLSSIIFSSLADSRTKAYNALIVQERHQLEIALQTYFNTYGYLPSVNSQGNLGTLECVGGNCIWRASAVTSYLAINTQENSNNSLFHLLALVGSPVNNLLLNFLPHISFTQSVFLNNIEYRGIIYDCMAYDSNKHCTSAAVYYPMFGVQPNARCDDGINSVIVQNIFDANTPVSDSFPSGFQTNCSGAPYTYHSGSL